MAIRGMGILRRYLGRTRARWTPTRAAWRKLNRLDAETAYVINVWGVGYRLVATS